MEPAFPSAAENEREELVLFKGSMAYESVDSMHTHKGYARSKATQGSFYYLSFTLALNTLVNIHCNSFGRLLL